MARTTMTSSTYTMRNVGQRAHASHSCRASVERNLLVRKKWQDSWNRCERDTFIRK